MLGFQPPFGCIKFGPFTGNGTLMKWFTRLNLHYGVSGRSSYLWKAHGAGKTPGVTSTDAQRDLLQGIRFSRIDDYLCLWLMTAC